MSRIWAGIDSGKGHHHGLVLDADGKTLLSRRVANDEPELLKLTSWTWPTAVRSPGPST
ncbi:transposase [Streptomyces capillispiralis]|uniref:Transposase n=1 Tax=Streptomyces capillispiralis TaxID=68182 RepID=A0A561SGC8_9ACTN|nr:transposase [Streptomyces capillispiralis]